MIASNIKRREWLGFAAGGVGFFFIAWLVAHVLFSIPLYFKIPGESMIRSNAGIAVVGLLFAAWAFWDE